LALIVANSLKRIEETDVMKLQGRAHGSQTSASDTPAARSWDLSDESMDVEPLQQPGDVGALAPALTEVLPFSEELTANVEISEAVDRVLAAEHRLEEGNVLCGCRIESPVAPPFYMFRLCDPSKFKTRFGGIVDLCQGVKIALVRAPTDLSVTVEV
jgi:hypothetical protein